MPHQSTPVYISEKGAADYLAVSLSTIRRWRHDRKGPEYFRLGDVLRYSVAALDDFIQKHTNPGA